MYREMDDIKTELHESKEQLLESKRQEKVAWDEVASWRAKCLNKNSYAAK
jgi:hypothetical protein